MRSYALGKCVMRQSFLMTVKDSTMSVLEIAGSVRYENGSKFAKAFWETMGVNPIEYRNTYH